DSPRATTSTPALAEIANRAPSAASQGRRGRTAGDVIATPAAALIVVCTGGCEGSPYGGREGNAWWREGRASIAVAVLAAIRADSPGAIACSAAFISSAEPKRCAASLASARRM